MNKPSLKRCVLITGGAKNTGLAIAHAFAQKGHDIFLTSRSEADAETTAGALRRQYSVNARGIAFDLICAQRAGEIFGIIRERGYVAEAVVLNAAALGLATDALTVSLEEWRSVIEANVTGDFQLARLSAAAMISAGVGGSILFIGSNTCKRAVRDRSAYIASKGAASSLCRALAVDFGKYGIRVNCLLPGPIRTDRWDSLSDEEVRARRARVPLNREASTQDIANAAYFLSTSLSANTTGAELIIDGGADARLFQA